jgi:hypothetical protein
MPILIAAFVHLSPICTMGGKRNGRFGKDGAGDRLFVQLAVIGGYSAQIVLSNPQVLKPGQPATVTPQVGCDQSVD